MKTIEVVIDAGHGGEDDGCMWPSFIPDPNWSRDERRAKYLEAKAAAEVVEDTLALELAKEVALSLHGLPINVSLTRYDDTPMTLQGRADFAKSELADLVISIHLNAGTTQHGADMFILPSVDESSRVADAIAKAMPATVNTGRVHVCRPAHWTERAYNVLEPHRKTHGKPVVLVEACYLTNSTDRGYIKSRWGRASIVSAVRAGVCRFGEIVESRHPKTMEDEKTPTKDVVPITRAEQMPKPQ